MSKPEGESYWVNIQVTMKPWSSPITSLYSGHQRRSSLLQVPGGRRVECGGDWAQGWEGGQHLECDGGDYVWCNQSVKQCFQVKKSDFEVFEALACDSFSLKNNEKNKSEKYFKSDSWCQVGFHLIDHTNLIFIFFRSHPTLTNLMWNSETLQHYHLIYYRWPITFNQSHQTNQFTNHVTAGYP